MSSTTADALKATIALDRALGVIDGLFTLEIQGGLDSLCDDSLASMLDVAMVSIKEAREFIMHIPSQIQQGDEA